MGSKLHLFSSLGRDYFSMGCNGGRKRVLESSEQGFHRAPLSPISFLLWGQGSYWARDILVSPLGLQVGTDGSLL